MPDHYFMPNYIHWEEQKPIDPPQLFHIRKFPYQTERSYKLALGKTVSSTQSTPSLLAPTPETLIEVPGMPQGGRRRQ